VQWIFGGPSHISDSGNNGNTNGFDLCGSQTSVSNGQHIVVYGLDGLAPHNNRPPPADDIESAASASSPNNVFVNPGYATTEPDGDFASANLSGDGPNSGSVVLQNFSPLVPLGSTIKSVTLKVRHQEAGPAEAKLVPSVSLVVNGTTRAVPVGGVNGTNNQSAMTEENIDITSLFAPSGFPAGSPGSQVTWKNVNSIQQVTYTADGSSLKKKTGHTDAETATDNLDGITIDVNYRPPGFETSSCSGAPSCYLIQTDTNSRTVFHGTAYAPTDGLDVYVHNQGEVIFDRGVILLTLSVHVSASSKQNSAPFSLPSTTVGRNVLFTASVNGTQYLRAIVHYVDTYTDPSTTVSKAYPGYSVQVKNWDVLRG
jgi:hypothetical protein